MKEKYIIETYLKLVNNPAEKKVLANLSENKMAKRIQSLVIPDLKNVKTSGGVLVLKRTSDLSGNIKYSGLSMETIIDILRNQNKVSFYPWKNKTV